MTQTISQLTELGKFLRTTKWADIVGINVTDPYMSTANITRPLVAIKLGQKPRLGFLVSDDEFPPPIGATHLFTIGSKGLKTWGKIDSLTSPDLHPISRTHYIDLWYRWKTTPKKISRIDKNTFYDWIIATAQSSADTVLRSRPKEDEVNIILDDLKFGNAARWANFRRRLQQKVKESH